MTIRGADAIAKTLKSLGVEVIFGMCGHGDLPVLDALIGSGIRFISVHHEQVAVHAADAYFRVTHKPGVVLTTLGPGALNTTTALGDAALDGSAVVVISADVPSRFEGFGAYQELDLNGGDEQQLVTRAVTKRSYRVMDPAALSYTIVRAWADSLSGCPGPVHVHVPMNFMSAKGEFRLFQPFEIRQPGLAQGVAQRILDKLNEAKRPVIYAGGGVITAGASDALTEFAEASSIPVVTSMIAQGAITEAHRFALGFSGSVGTQPANFTMRQADVVLAIGTRFSEMDSSSWHDDKFIRRDAEVIHVDIDPRQIGRIYPPTIGAIADAREALVQLAELARKSAPPKRVEYWRELDELKKNWAKDAAELSDQPEFPFQPAYVIDAVRRVMPDDAIFVAGVGVRHMVGQLYEVREPATMLVASGLSTMGWETPAALGAKVGRPDVDVIAVIGDGAFNSTVSALPTAVAEGIDITWVLLDNLGYQCIGAYQDRHYGRRIATDWKLFPDGSSYQIDYVGLAKAYGAQAERVDDPAKLEGALRRAVGSKGNYLLHLPVDPLCNYRALASGAFDVNTLALENPELVPAPLR